MIKNILYVEDGSVDLDELESTLTTETKIIVYRQGSYPPTLVQPRLPINDISSEAEFTGNRNTGDFNPGYSKTVDGNTGDSNTGNWNAGIFNTGDCNTGNWNTGHCNIGDYNTGNRNTGDRNTGDWNTGHRNTGNCNTGNCNTGDCNTGYRNAGNFNTGHFNACNYSSGFFCTEEPKVRLFNKEIDISVPEFRESKYYCALFSSPFTLTEEIDGKLVEYNYKEACAKWWAEMSEDNKKIVKSIPNFDAEIFEEITGIKEA
jgi:hypothetical protein